MRGRRAEAVNRIVLFVFMAGVATAMNTPLARFPWQDLIWNDLVVLGRVAWLRESVTARPLATIDFRQGMGSEVRSDLKVVPHFYDPAVPLAALTDPITGLRLRSFLLVLYCLLCLDRLWRQNSMGIEGDRLERLRVPLLAAYVFSPQLFFEVSHHFSAIFYAIPGLIVGLRAWLRSPSVRSAMAFGAAAAVLVGLSDLHVVFLAPTLAAFLVLFDGEVRRAPWPRIGAAAAAFASLVLLSYVNCFSALAGPRDLVVAQATGWPLPVYWNVFLKPVLLTTVMPTFHGPICIYLSPYLPLFLLLLVVGRSRGVALRVGALLALFLALYGVGAVLHGIAFCQTRLPSAMRYHLAVIPLLANLFLVYEVRATADAVARLRPWARLGLVGLCLTVSYVGARAFANPGSSAFLALNDFVVQPDVLTWRWSGVIALALLPVYLVASVAFGSAFVVRRPLGLLAGALLALAMGGTYFVARCFALPPHNFMSVDKRLYAALYKEMPRFIADTIRASPYASAPRSLVTVARDVITPGVGRNDKLLPLIEYPEAYGGRSFFHWRYSYTSHASALYSTATGLGPVFFFPPASSHVAAAVAFAVTTESPFLVSADDKIADPNLILLGSHRISADPIAEDLDTLNRGLLGKIYLYAVRPVVEGTGRSFREAEFSRTSVRFRHRLSSAPFLRLPISFLPGLRAEDQQRRVVHLLKGPDGFAYAVAGDSVREIVVTSRSPMALLSLLAPVPGLLILWWASRVAPPPARGHPAQALLLERAFPKRRRRGPGLPVDDPQPRLPRAVWPWPLLWVAWEKAARRLGGPATLMPFSERRGRS